MKFLILFILFFIHCFPTEAQCNKAFTDRPTNQQFIETLTRYFSIHKKKLEQKSLEKTVRDLVNKGKKRKEILDYLVQEGHLKIEGDSNPLFHYILTKSYLEVIQLINEKPHLLYKGTLMDIPPFFLIVFVGDKQVVDASLKIDPELVHSRNTIDEIPLHYGIDTKITTNLLFNDSNPDAQDKKGRAALHHVRSPAITKAILYHRANPILKDYSGVSIIKYHQQFVHNQQIIDLLVEAHAAQKPARMNRERKPVIVVEKTEEERRVEEEKRAQEATREAEEKWLENAIRKEEEQKARQAREEAKVRKEEKRKKAIERTNRIKDQLISEIAETMATVIMQKTILKGNIKNLLQINIPEINGYLQGINMRISSIMVFQKEFELQFEKKITALTRDTTLTSAKEKFLKNIEEETLEMEYNLRAKLEHDIYSMPVKKLKQLSNKVEKQSAKLIKITDRIKAIIIIIKVLLDKNSPLNENPIPLSRKNLLTEGFIQSIQTPNQ